MGLDQANVAANDTSQTFRLPKLTLFAPPQPMRTSRMDEVVASHRNTRADSVISRGSDGGQSDIDDAESALGESEAGDIDDTASHTSLTFTKEKRHPRDTGRHDRKRADPAKGPSKREHAQVCECAQARRAPPLCVSVRAAAVSGVLKRCGCSIMVCVRARA